MSWVKPSFQEVTMDSEIGAYQDEFDERKAGDPLRAQPPVEPSNHVSHPALPQT